jgi:glycosyltransferase involved in cell wall biosynthesis
MFAAQYPIAVVVESDTPPPFANTRWKAMVKRIVYPWLFRVPEMFLPGGTRQSQYLKQYGVPENRIRIANMTVDTLAITDYVDARRAGDLEAARSRFGLKQGGITLLFVGRVEEHKGVLCLVQAFEALQQSYKDVNLLIVGDGQVWRQICEATSGNDGVVLTGRLSGNDLLDAYAVADVFVLPSFFEPWGLVVNEAMAAGLPAIVSERVGCVDDLVVSEETGLLVKVNSVESLSMAMSRLADNSELRYHMSLNARAHIKSWTLENEAEIIIETWEKICNQ